MPSAQKNKKLGGKILWNSTMKNTKMLGIFARDFSTSEMTALPSLNRVTKPITAATVAGVTDRDRDRPRRNRQEF